MYETNWTLPLKQTKQTGRYPLLSIFIHATAIVIFFRFHLFIPTQSSSPCDGSFMSYF